MSMPSMGGEIRPFPVRFDPVQRERLDLLSQLTGRSATDIVREGTERLLDELSVDPEIRARVDDHVAEIRKEAEARQAAVNALFGTGTPEPEPGSDPEDEPDEDGTAAGDEDPALDLDDQTTPVTPPAKKTPSSRRSSRTSGK